MKVKQIFILLGLWVFALFGASCLTKQDELIIETQDTTTMSFSKRGLLLDTRSTNGLADAKVSLYAMINKDSTQLITTAKTDSNGLFHVNFVYLKFNRGFRFVFEHASPVFMKRTYNTYEHQEKINDSTELYYLHRKSGCKVSLKNSDGTQKNVMLFNSTKSFSKLLMNLKKDTSFYYLLQDYTDNVYFDYFPQKSLQSIPVKGSTSGDTINIEFRY